MYKLDIGLENKGKNIIIAHLDGHLNYDNTPKAKNTLSSLDCKALYIDFKKVNFIDRSGIGLLLEMQKEMKEGDKKVAYYGFNNYVKSVIELTKLIHVITTYDTLEDVLKQHL